MDIHEQIQNYGKSLESGLQKYGIKKLKQINYEMEAEYKRNKWMMTVCELEFVIEYQDGDVSNYEFLDGLYVSEEFEDTFYEDEKLQRLLCDAPDKMQNFIQKLCNEYHSQEDAIILSNLERTEKDSYVFD